MQKCDSCGKECKMVKVVWTSDWMTISLCADCYDVYCEKGRKERDAFCEKERKVREKKK